MAKLLHIESSPRKARSASIAVAKEFLTKYQEANPADEVDNWDLWSTSLPEFDGATIDAKYQILHGQDHTPEQAAAWKGVTDVFDRFNSADKYVLSLPMWNFAIPYKLKHLIDVITQPGLAFSFSPETGYTGLVTGKPITVIYARGGEYTSSEQMKALDFQKSYVEFLLGFIGFTDIQTILVEPMLAPPEVAGAAKDSAKQKAAEIAASF
ncbi:NAD(P)H-dependent oxidoreductase [Blastopirellula sp. JC732]|uniref:FMN dependent NADH:quinone oxidoreductase n=1 Tax=Blastopirellula sediminis TaxID=2894196 RepID=A0A9X1SHX1_9BACT|nr:NAD(P)H-dependent oxidoreductase [Blastopirellula sediminis]MCC9605772.1 NAD(P)H-dependent oxidoreductase [Blastopirellula sediminis]MCC9630928.1 NAD(P)H-dependent oxidoreductase [Blastopirellula sediminis]